MSEANEVRTPMVVSAIFQFDPLWKYGSDGTRGFGGDLEVFTKQLTAYFAEQLERFGDPRNADLLLMVQVTRGGQSAGHQYRSGHYVKDGTESTQSSSSSGPPAANSV